jgi:hypothetical protein
MPCTMFWSFQDPVAVWSIADEEVELPVFA